MERKNVPPAPNVQNLPASQGQGQLIALGLSPADVHGPINVPSGNRSGEFHASPGGKADAPGTPNVVGTGKDSSGGNGRGAGNGLPPGITVGAPPPGAITSATAGMPRQAARCESRHGSPQAHDRRGHEAFAAQLSRPPTSSATSNLPEDPDLSIEKRVFRAKPYYSLVMNMPNLTSANGKLDHSLRRAEREHRQGSAHGAGGHDQG